MKINFKFIFPLEIILSISFLHSMQPTKRPRLSNDPHQALITAIINNNVSEVEKALQNGADPNLVQNGFTPLSRAIIPVLATPSKPDYSIIKMLLQKGAQPDLKFQILSHTCTMSIVEKTNRELECAEKAHFSSSVINRYKEILNLLSQNNIYY